MELATLDLTIKLDIRYATTNNFLGTPVYSQPRAFLQRPAAEALLRASKKLNAMGYGLLIHDAYRPWYVTKIFWDATPEDKHVFVADPSQGSRHNRGCAVDLSLYELDTGKPVAMVGVYDEMSERSYQDIRVAPLWSVGAANYCVTRWKTKGFSSTRLSGGISIMAIGRNIRF